MGECAGKALAIKENPSLVGALETAREAIGNTNSQPLFSNFDVMTNSSADLGTRNPVECLAVATAPEPASFAEIMAGILGVLGFLKWRMRRSSAGDIGRSRAATRRTAQCRDQDLIAGL